MLYPDYFVIWNYVIIIIKIDFILFSIYHWLCVYKYSTERGMCVYHVVICCFRAATHHLSDNYLTSRTTGKLRFEKSVIFFLKFLFFNNPWQFQLDFKLICSLKNTIYALCTWYSGLRMFLVIWKGQIINFIFINNKNLKLKKNISSFFSLNLLIN